MKRLSARLTRFEMTEDAELVLVPRRPGETLGAACRRAGVDAAYRPGRVLVFGDARNLDIVAADVGPAHHVVDAATAAKAAQILVAAGVCDAGEA